MKVCATVWVSLVLAVHVGWAAEQPAGEPVPPPKSVVRCAVIGGMTMTGMWPELAKLFEAKYPYRVEVAVTGQRPKLAAALRAGQVDLLTMHSGDITTDLVADGYGVNMRPWTRNDLVIAGPAADPAGIAGMADGAKALRQIAEKRAGFLDWDDAGAREMAHGLWMRAGMRPVGDWVIPDRAGHHLDVLQYAQDHNAYLIMGRMPIISHKARGGEEMRILVDTDPTMRRPYIVMEANPEKCPGVNAAGARALSDFMLSDEAQRFLLGCSTTRYRTDRSVPLFYPIKDVAPAEAGLLHVYSTDSIQPALDAAAQAYQRATGVTVKVTYCKTKQAYELARKEKGDVYCSSHADGFQAAQQEGLAVTASARVIAYLTVAIAVPKGNPRHIAQLTDLTASGLRVGLGDPEVSNLGRTSQLLLQEAKLTDAVKPNVAGWGDCCSTTAALLTAGKVDVVLGWASFEKLAPEAVEIVRLPADLARPMPVTGFVLTTSEQRDAAARFLAFLYEGDGKDIVEGLGYTR